MSSEGLHVPREKLSKKTLNMHYAISSLIEELEAVDWYQQRAEATSDAELKPTVGQVGHMNLIHPFRLQILGAAECTYLRGLPVSELFLC